MYMRSFSTRQARLAIGVLAQFTLVSALAACSDDEDRGTTSSSHVTGPAPVAFAKGQDKGPTTTRRIAFVGQFHKIVTVRPDGTDPVQLPGSNAVEDEDPAWSADYQKLAFVSNRSGGINQLHTANADGTNIEHILPGHYVRNPTFSPDGRKIVFQNSSISGAGNWDLWVIDLETRTVVPLTTDPANDMDPHFSPDGSKIVFSSSRSGQAEVYTMNADGSNQTRATFCGVACTSPKFSPDGTRLTFASAAFGLSVLVTAPGDVMRYQSLTPANQSSTEYFVHPSWSPDGKKVAFEGSRNGVRGLFTVNVDGTGLGNITPGVTARSVAWSW